MAHSALIDDLERQFLENPRRVFARLANEYRKSGDYERAIEVCSVHVPQQPSYISGHIVLGQALFETGRLDEAQQAFETAIALDPENLIALRQLGDIARERGDAPSARDWYHRLLEIDPQNDAVAAHLEALDASPAPQPSAAPAAEESAPSWSDIHPEDADAATGERAVESDVDSHAGGDLAGTLLDAEVDIPAVSGYESTSAAGEDAPATVEPASHEQDDGLAPWERAAAQAGGLEGGIAGAELLSERPPHAGEETLVPDLDVDLQMVDASDAAVSPGHASASDEYMALPHDGPEAGGAAEFHGGDASVEGVEGIIRETGPFDSDDLEDLELSPGITAHEDRVVHIQDGVRASAGLSIDTGSLTPDREVLLPEFGVDDSVDVDAVDLESAALPTTGASEPEPAVEPGVEPGVEPYDEADASHHDGVAGGIAAEEQPIGGGEAEPARRATAGAAEPDGFPAEPPQAEPGTPTQFVTETMAELYLRQGFVGEALSIFRQLSEREPDNGTWGQRVAELESEILTGTAAGAHAAPAEQVAANATVGALLARLAARRPPVGWEGGHTNDIMLAPNAPVGEHDQTAATTLAGAFSPEYHPPTATAPRATRAAADELSLDDVFRDRSAPSQEQSAGGMSFDEFFSQQSDDTASEGTPQRPEGGPPPEASDLELFHAWLEGLKK